MKKYSGIDLHSNNSVVQVGDEADRVLYRRRLPNELGKILEALEPHREELVGVVVEATYNWYWLVDGLQAAGYTVYLAHPAAMKRYEGLKHSDDDDDAIHLPARGAGAAGSWAAAHAARKAAHDERAGGGERAGARDGNSHDGRSHQALG